MNSSVEGLSSLFCSLVDDSNNARSFYNQGSLSDTLNILKDIKRTADKLERILNAEQRPTSHDEPPHAAFPRHERLDCQDPDQAYISHSHQSSIVSQHGTTPISFKNPQSPESSFVGGPNPNPNLNNNNNNNPTASISRTGSRSGSRSGSESGSSFPLSATGGGYRYHSKETSDYHDPKSGAPWHAPIEGNFIYSENENSAHQVIRQRNSSLPHIPSSHQPPREQQHYRQHSHHRQSSITPPTQYGFQTIHPGYPNPNSDQGHPLRGSPPSPSYTQHQIDPYPQSHHQHHFMQYEKTGIEDRIRTRSTIEEEEGYDQYRVDNHHPYAPQPQGGPQHRRIARRSSQPSYMPDQRNRFSAQMEMQDNDYNNRGVVAPSEEIERRGSGGSTKAVMSSVGNTNSVNGRANKRETTTGSTVTSTQRTDITGSRTQFHAPLEPEVVARLDEIFFRFLQRICSDLNACDSKGDHIHQPLMAKKMERLDMSMDFRPFKFRIQAFTNAFHDDLIKNGLTEDILPLRKVKVYLWKHRYISRFNEDGKKQKSKGNHVWNIEARKISNIRSQSSADDRTNGKDHYNLDLNGNVFGSDTFTAAGGGEGNFRRPSSPVRWEFREYSSRIAGQVIKFARVGVPYVYSPRIWDAQMSCPAAKFRSPWLPNWLKWHKGELKGIPGPEDESCTITVIAEYYREGEECCLEMSFPLTVSDPSKDGELMDTQHEIENDNENENENEYGDEAEEYEDEYRGQSGNSRGSRGHQSTLSQTSNQAQYQAQNQLKYLQIQDNSKQRSQPPQRRSGSRSDDEIMTSDDLQEIEEDELDEGIFKKQSRDRHSLIHMQEAKRRKH